MDIIARKLAAEELETLSATMAEAFSEDPVMRLIYDRPGDMRRLMRASLRYCDKLGRIYASADLRAAAAWLPPGVPFLSVGNVIRRGLAGPALDLILRSSPASTARLLRVSGIIAGGHFAERPHHYLWAIGTARSARGRGYGRALMERALEDFGPGACCYLENSNPANAGFYERGGFSSLGKIDVLGAPVELMLRN